MDIYLLSPGYYARGHKFLILSKMKFDEKFNSCGIFSKYIYQLNLGLYMQIVSYRELTNWSKLSQGRGWLVLFYPLCLVEYLL